MKGGPPQNFIRLVSGYYLYLILRIWLVEAVMENYGVG